MRMAPPAMRSTQQGRLHTCETRTRRVTRTDKNGKIEVLADKWEGKRLNAPSGIVVSKNGHVYFTDPAFGDQSDHRELDFHGVYHIPPKGPDDPGGEVRRPPARHCDLAQRPHPLRLQRRTTTTSAPTISTTTAKPPTSACSSPRSPARPAGIAVDAQGNLWVTAKGLVVYTVPKASASNTSK